MVGATVGADVAGADVGIVGFAVVEVVVGLAQVLGPETNASGTDHTLAFASCK